MSGFEKALNAHYGQSELGSKILEALLAAGTDIGDLKREDLEPLDQFHIGGLGETRNLANLADLDGGMRVLDVGAGIGGPARTLAAEFGCRVMALDLTEEFVRAGELLTNRVGLGDQVDFRCANALEMPFEEESFERVWMQHVTMNIEDKAGLFREVHRVLCPGGRLALYEICQGPGSGFVFPVPWAGEAKLSFLASPEELDDLVGATGLKKTQEIDKTAFALEWFETMTAAKRPTGGPASLGMDLISPDFPRKAANLLENLRCDRVRVIQRIYQR